MHGNRGGRILIHEGIDGNHYSAAFDQAGLLESLIRDNPAESLAALSSYQHLLENPAVTPAELTHPAGSASERQREVAWTVATLLASTNHGSFIEFDELTYDVLATDNAHRQLVHDAQNADRRRTDPHLARRRVVLSSLTTFIRTWHIAQGPEETDEDPAA